LKIPVTVIVATRNEETRLPDCLNALSAFNEVIVVDSASTDRTAAIAREFSAEVVNFIWNGQYPKKRQWCLEHVETKHEWVFFVDADEIVTAGLVDELQSLFNPHPGAGRDPLRSVAPWIPACAGMTAGGVCAGYFVKGRYIWNGKPLNHGLKNNKLALLDKRKFEFPVVDDLDFPGMGEMEGHYQPVLKKEYAREDIGQLKAELDHNAAQTEEQWFERHRRYAAWERGMNVRKAWPHDPVKARQVLKVAFRAMPFRGAVAFLHCYIWKGGISDGAPGFDFARKRAAYYKMISWKD